MCDSLGGSPRISAFFFENYFLKLSSAIPIAEILCAVPLKFLFLEMVINCLHPLALDMSFPDAW
jgi:hypothetical protein